MKIIIRPHYSYLHEARFDALIEKLLETKYKIGAEDADAPRFTDCVTATRYLLEYSSDFTVPKVYIGDLPHFLLKEGSHMISLEEAKKGDLIFFERMSFRHRKYMIAHVGVVLSEFDFFHSSLHFDGGKISSLGDIDYNSIILDESFLELASDPRNPPH